MDCRNGDIIYPEQMERSTDEIYRDELKHFVPLTDELVKELEPLGKTLRKNTMRNKLCVCGSGIKFKRCCWNRFA